MRQERYNRLVNQLLEAIETLELGEFLREVFLEISIELQDDNLTEEMKYKLSLDAEHYLGVVQDFPRKKNGSEMERK